MPLRRIHSGCRRWRTSIVSPSSTETTRAEKSMALISEGNSRQAINNSMVLRGIIYIIWSVLLLPMFTVPFGLLSGYTDGDLILRTISCHSISRFFRSNRTIKRYSTMISNKSERIYPTITLAISLAIWGYSKHDARPPSACQPMITSGDN